MPRRMIECDEEYKNKYQVLDYSTGVMYIENRLKKDYIFEVYIGDGYLSYTPEKKQEYKVYGLTMDQLLQCAMEGRFVTTFTQFSIIFRRC